MLHNAWLHDIKMIPKECDLVLGEVSSLLDEMVNCVCKEVDQPKLKCHYAHVGCPGTLSLCQIIHNVSKTKAEIRRKNLIQKAKRSLALSTPRTNQKSNSITLDINVNVDDNKSTCVFFLSLCIIANSLICYSIYFVTILDI